MESTTLHIAAEEKKTDGTQDGRVRQHSNNLDAEQAPTIAMDIFETDHDLVFIIPIAGVHPKEVEVLITEDVLTISGERTFPNDTMQDERTAFVEECYWGKFSRSIILPAAVNSGDAVAKYSQGILTVTIPKAKKVKSKRVPVQVEENKKEKETTGF